MDFLLSEQQKMLRTLARDFSVRDLEPVSASIDEESRYPAEAVKEMGRLGLMGVPFPEAYGGSGGGPMEFAIVVEEIARISAAIATILFVTAGLAGKPLWRFGNEEQRKRLVIPVAKGEKIACFALTEACAGSDAAAIQTTATRQAGGYILNGSKLFVSNGNEAEIALVFATVDKSLRHKGIVALVVEKGTPGISVGKIEHKLGIRASSTVELVFEDCFVPEANRLGEEGEGFRIALESLNSSRISVAAQAVGIAQGAFDRSLAYGKGRTQFGQPITSFQAIQWFLSDMATQIEAARLLTYRAACLEANGVPFQKEASMAKVFASDVAAFVTTKAVQIHGGYGYVKDYPVERYFRDARITGIYEGTDEMQRMNIARHIMKEAA